MTIGHLQVGLPVASNQVVVVPFLTFDLLTGIIHLARQGSLKLRNSLRRHGSIHRREDHNHHLSTVSSSENLITSVSW